MSFWQSRSDAYQQSDFVTQAEEVIHRMMYLSSQSDIITAAHTLDALVGQVIAKAGLFDNDLSQIRSLMALSLGGNPDDRFHDLRARILEQEIHRLL